MKNYYSNYATCDNVFNIRRNNAIIGSECPFGMKGLQNGITFTECSTDLCERCSHYTNRKADIVCVESSSKDRYKERKIKDMLFNKKRENQKNKKSYLYNEIMINQEDDKFFQKQCRDEKVIRNKDSKDNKTIKLTDIY